MSLTGTYLYVPGEGLVKVSDEVPRVTHRDAWMPKGDLKYYDKSARRWFHSRSEKRQWLKEHKLREGGRITCTDKRWEGPTRNATKPTMAQKKARTERQAWLASQGGTAGLLKRVQAGHGNFL